MQSGQIPSPPWCLHTAVIGQTGVGLLVITELKPWTLSVVTASKTHTHVSKHLLTAYLTSVTPSVNNRAWKTQSLVVQHSGLKSGYISSRSQAYKCNTQQSIHFIVFSFICEDDCLSALPPSVLFYLPECCSHRPYTLTAEWSRFPPQKAENSTRRPEEQN